MKFIIEKKDPKEILFEVECEVAPEKKEDETPEYRSLRRTARDIIMRATDKYEDALRELEGVLVTQIVYDFPGGMTPMKAVSGGFDQDLTCTTFVVPITEENVNS
jgi:hypothetical protein